MKKTITIIVLCLMALLGFAQSTNTFEYDNLNRLTKVTYANGAVVQYTYDAVGNRLTKTVEGVNATTTQSQPLTTGWNWWSTYVEQSGTEGLTQLENSLGAAGVIIKSRNDGYVESYTNNGTVSWFGSLTSISNEQMYKINTNANSTASMTGYVAGTSSHPITINSGWNWIGFPVNQSVSVSTAMGNFSPEVDDVIKGRNSYTTYYSSNGQQQWFGTLNTLEPGCGYMYQSQSGSSKTLVFQPGRGEATMANITPDDNLYRPEDKRFADNMTVTAVVEVDGEELRSDRYELAAFVGGECRGSVRLMYVEPIDRYEAFLTVFGETGEEVEFRMTDGSETLYSDDRMTFMSDGITGNLTTPIVLHFTMTGIDEATTSMVRFYPNPVDRNAHFTISLPLDEVIKEVTVTNTLGAVVRHETGALKATMEGLPVTGVYMVKVMCHSGNVYIERLIVK